MRHLVRQVVVPLTPLILLIGALAWGGMLLVDKGGQAWFDHDTELRAALAVRGAEDSIAGPWRTGDRPALTHVLESIARDERIMAVAACLPDGTLVASTPGYPPAFGCRNGPPLPDRSDRVRSRVGWSEGGRVLVSAVPMVDDQGTLGSVLLLHDMSFADRRQRIARGITLASLALLAAVVSFVTVIAARASWSGWTAEMRRLLRGERREPAEFGPLMSDIRELRERLSAEAQVEGGGGTWDPARLRQTLRRYLHGERIVIVANREPYIHQRDEDGSVRILHPASGLVTALEPVMRACSGVWVAHGAGTADRESADARGRLDVPPGNPQYRLRRVWLSREEEDGYYYGFANEGLWPLCHIAHARPTFRTTDWTWYQEVNSRFAEAALEEVDSDDPIMLVQDYHFALLPRMIRQRLHKATLLTFWHIPWPNAERLGICPWASELLEGLLGSSIIGFHTQRHCNNFLDSVDRFLEARIDREQQGVVHGGRLTLVRPYPISIEWPSQWVAAAPPVEECRRGVRAELGLAPDALLGVGVDRLDYTKGIEERFLAVEALLERAPEMRGRFTFVQVGAPSRTRIARYQDLARSVEAMAERVNARYATKAWRPIVFLRRHLEPPVVFRYYRAAELCYVSSLDDGMNLVAKEFVAARDDRRGVLVLSSFAGAARELTGALIVNPYDVDQASAALLAAVNMPVEEQETRMEAMRLLVAEFNVYRWAGRMIVDAARTRQRDRLSGRLFGPPSAARSSLS